MQSSFSPLNKWSTIFIKLFYFLDIFCRNPNVTIFSLFIFITKLSHTYTQCMSTLISVLLYFVFVVQSFFITMLKNIFASWFLFLFFHFRFAPVKELVPVGTPVGTILAAAINQTIFYAIVAGNELGICYTPYTTQ